MLPRAFLLTTLWLVALAGGATAATEHPKMQMLFLGATPEQHAPGPLPADLPAIALQSLPEVQHAQQTVFAARLRASPVSTFVAQPSAENAQFEQFFLIAQVGLSEMDGFEVEIGGGRHSLTEFADRVSALVGAFNPKHRRVGLIRMTDPDDVFPMAIAEVQGALDGIGFDLVVVMIEEPTAAGCADAEALHYSLTSGMSDRAPFGNGDGVSTTAEVEAYLTRALNRQSTRAASCGPKYSVLLKSGNDPDAPLVSFGGRSPFPEVETRLYNETFEAQFLLQSDDRAQVQEFLASCIFCPNEGALSDRLLQMEEFARTNALEAEIWDRIRSDETPNRLAIYLENCTLCAFKDEVSTRIEELAAEERARTAEARRFQTAASARDILGLRDYLQSCATCSFEGPAQSLIAEIEADEAYRRELAELDIALAAKDVTLLSAYIEDCKICDGKPRAARALERAHVRASLLEPCLAAAALPQLGGPRQLAQIDRGAAALACDAAVAEFPGDGEVVTTLGRIAQAAGDSTEAARAYALGMKAEVPAAFGLAAYTHYAPPEGGEIDLVEAERLAQIGAAKGDWLSREILAVLYSKGLVPGRTPQEAVEIARGLADEGNAMGAFFLGFYHLNGTGLIADPTRAEIWLRKSVDQGYVGAMSYLAEVYESGELPRPAEAADLYWAALRTGDAAALDRLTTQLGSRNREVIRLIQGKLQAEGAYRGLLDGIPGPGTVAAIQSYAETLGTPDRL